MNATGPVQSSRDALRAATAQQETDVCVLFICGVYLVFYLMVLHAANILPDMFPYHLCVCLIEHSVFKPYFWERLNAPSPLNRFFHSIVHITLHATSIHA